MSIKTRNLRQKILAQADVPPRGRKGQNGASRLAGLFDAFFTQIQELVALGIVYQGAPEYVTAERRD